MVRVDELLAGRGHVGEDPEPAVGVLTRERSQDGLDRRTADAVEPVATGDHVAVEPVLLPVVLEAHVGLVAVEPVNAHVVHLEEQRQRVVEPRCDQVLHDLGLAVDHDAPPARQLVHRNMMSFAVELEMDAAVHDRLRVQALGHPRALEQLDRSLFQHARANSSLDVLTAPILEHYGFDPGLMQERSEDQPGRAGTDDRDVCAQAPHDSSSTCWAIANARLAAGTPQ